MKVVFILGPQAVGKMTIGEALSKKMNVPLLFNHMTLDIIHPFIGWGPDTFRISQMIRSELFETIAKNDENPGIIMTMLMFFDHQPDWDILNSYIKTFEQYNREVCIVELEAQLDERLRRNSTENRLAKKPTKRDLGFSKKELLHANEKHRLNSNPEEVAHLNYFKIDVTTLTPEEVCEKIVSHFGL